jgi:hypothetical protein
MGLVKMRLLARTAQPRERKNGGKDETVVPTKKNELSTERREMNARPLECEPLPDYWFNDAGQNCRDI